MFELNARLYFKKKKKEDVNPHPDNKLIYVVVNRYCFGYFISSVIPIFITRGAKPHSVKHTESQLCMLKHTDTNLLSHLILARCLYKHKMFKLRGLHHAKQAKVDDNLLGPFKPAYKISLYHYFII